MWLWVDRDTIAVLRKIVRKAENDALERAADKAHKGNVLLPEVNEFMSGYARGRADASDDIRSLKDTK